MNPLSRFQKGSLISAVLLLLCAVFCTSLLLPPDTRFFREFGENDFLEYWTSYQLAERGMDLYKPELVMGVEQKVGWAEERPLMMWNPPWTLTLLQPILQMPYDEAARTFLGLNIGLSIVIVILAGIALGFDGGLLIAFALLAVGNFPLYLLLDKGQISLLPTLGIALLYLGLMRNRPIVAGLAMLPLSVKPHLAFLCFIPLLFEVVARRWKAFFLSAGIGMGILLFLTWILFPESLGFWWNRSLHESSPLLIKVSSWKTTTLSFLIRDVLRYYTGKLPTWPMWAIPLMSASVVLLFSVLRPRWLQGEAESGSHFAWKYLLPLLLPLSIATGPFGWIFDCSSLMISAFAVLALAMEPKVSSRAKCILLACLFLLQGGTLFYGISENPTLEVYWFYPLLFVALSYAVWVYGTSSGEMNSPPSLARSPLRQALQLPFFLILGLAALLRFLFLLGLPPFFDESGNILVSTFPPAQTILSPLRQARPLLAYQFALAGILPGDPVFIARACTGLSSLISLVLLFLMLLRVSGPVAAFTAATFWALNPFQVFHERMVLQDPYLSMFLLIALSRILLSKNFPRPLAEPAGQNWAMWIFSGAFFGVAVSTKITAVEIFPALFLLVGIFASRAGLKSVISRNLFNGLLLFGVASVFVLFLISGTFHDFGVDHMSLGHLASPATKKLGFVAKMTQHLAEQFGLLSSYLGAPFAVLYLGLLALGLFFASTRPVVLLILLLFLFHTQLYQGRWYTRYFHPDFILHAFFLGMLAQEIADRRQWSVGELGGKKALRVASSFACGALFLWSPELYPTVFHPMQAPVPAHDAYTKGYVSGNGVIELRAKIDEELKTENRVVVFACQYWGTGMYELLRHSLTLPPNKLFVMPFELFHPNRVLGILKLMHKFEEELPGKTTFVFLFESPRYPPPTFLKDLGLPLTEIYNSLREPIEEDEFRFWLEKIGEVSEEEILKKLVAQKSPYPDDWIGPKAEMLVDAPPSEDLFLSLPKDLPGSTQVEVKVGENIVFQKYAADLDGPLPLPISMFASAGKDHPLSFQVHCSDWIIPQLSSGRRDNRALCAKLSGKLSLSLVKGTETSSSKEATLDSSNLPPPQLGQN